jgi:hypothetical protein
MLTASAVAYADVPQAGDSQACSRDDAREELEKDPSILLQSRFELDRGLNFDHAAAAPAPKIMVLGDSNAQMSCDDLGRFCGGSQVVNMAVGGATAKQWSEDRCTFGDKKQGQNVSDKCPDHVSCCNATKAFSPKFGSGYTHAWITLGGNDFLDSKPCGSVRGAVLQARLEAAIVRIRAAGPPGLKLVMTGYVSPSVLVEGGQEYLEKFGCGTSPTVVKPVNDAIAAAVASQAAKGVDVTYVDVAYVTGATPTTLSPGSGHADAIHLNSKGYCKVMSDAKVQAALGCSAATTCSPQQCDGAERANVGYECRKVADLACGRGGVGGITKTTPKPSTSCKDDDAAIIAAAAGLDPPVHIAGCGDVADHCDNSMHKDSVRELCPKTCNSCPKL